MARTTIPLGGRMLAADQIALSYHRSFETPVTVVRPFNTFGPRQSTRAIIPTIISQAVQRDVIEVGSRDPIRDMVFVKDTARGFIACGESDACIGEVTNLATGVGVTVGELIDKITILEIKSVRIASKEAVANVRLELDMLNERSAAMLSAKPDVVALKGQLTEVNEALWEIEDKIRDKEAAIQAIPEVETLPDAVELVKGTKRRCKGKVWLVIETDDGHRWQEVE